VPESEARIAEIIPYVSRNSLLLKINYSG